MIWAKVLAYALWLILTGMSDEDASATAATKFGLPASEILRRL